MQNNYWGATQKILLVVKFTTVDEIHAYRSAIKSVQLNVNDCVILALTKDKKEAKMQSAIHSVVYCSEKEINFLGKWKNEDAVKSINRFFDLVLVVGDQPSKVLRQVKKVKNTLSVGINTNADFLTVTLKSEDRTPEHLLNFTKRTLEKII